MDPFRISANGHALKGKQDVDRSTTPPRISAELHGTTFDINHAPTTSANVIEDVGKDIDRPSGDVISDQDLDWSWLEDADLDVHLSLDRLTVNQTRFSNPRIRVAMQDERLDIDPIDADLEKGSVQGHVRVR